MYVIFKLYIDIFVLAQNKPKHNNIPIFTSDQNLHFHVNALMSNVWDI